MVIFISNKSASSQRKRWVDFIQQKYNIKEKIMGGSMRYVTNFDKVENFTKHSDRM